MSDFPILLPPLYEQESIAGLLGALDEKIGSNHRLADLFEKMLAAVFQGRFVEPFVYDHAKRPRGWALVAIGDLAVAQRDPIATNNGLPYVGLNEMPKGSTILDRWLTEGAPSGQGSRFKCGDILFGKLRPYFRKVGVAPIDGRCSTEILVLRPHDDRYWGFVLGHVASQKFIDHCVAVSRGTRMPRAEWKDAGSFVVCTPPPGVAAEHTQLALELYAKIRSLVLEASTLAAVRDALLPKLISGEVRLPDSSEPEEVTGTVTEAVGA